MLNNQSPKSHEEANNPDKYFNLLRYITHLGILKLKDTKEIRYNICKKSRSPLMKNIILSLLLGTFSSLFATPIIGHIENYSGSVKVKNATSIKKIRVKKGLEIFAGDTLTSSQQATAKLKLVDGSTLVLDQSSTLHFNSITDAKQLSGKILYKVSSHDAKNSLQINTPFAIIGVRGTTFIVNATDDASVKLQEGKLGIYSKNEEFELYKQKQDRAFQVYKKEGEEYLKKQDEAFAKYKNEQSNYEKPIRVKEFSLEAGNSISFDGNRVKENTFSQDDYAEFEYFNRLIQSMQ